MFNKILIANRGEIACRIIRTAQRLGVDTVAVYSDADKHAMHVQMATTAVHIGHSPVNESYLVGEKIINAAKVSGAQAIHPGYGFLSENPDFVDAVEAAGFVFIGPSADAIRAMGLKDAAKQRMADAGVPVVPGYHGAEQDPDFLQKEANKIGYPLLVKARSGGGGKGMRLVTNEAEFKDQLASAAREAQAAFGDPVVLLEKFIESPRHIEVQVFGDATGEVVHLFERDCSLQRRHQKVIEEAPAPGMSESVRHAMTTAAITAAKTIGYTSAGTIEFIVDGQGALKEDGFWFMEMNTRLQVEHPVTEAITGYDLVEWQLRVAAGEPIPVSQSQIKIQGHSVEARLYAEDPAADFLPVSGQLHHVSFPEHARIDTGVRTADAITPFYDPMIAKVTTHGADRAAALQAMAAALSKTHIAGTQTNLDFLSALIQQPDFQAGTMDTGLIEEHLDSLLIDSAVTPVERLLACLVLSGYASNSCSVVKENVQNNWQTGWRLWGNTSQRVTLMNADELNTHRFLVSGNSTVQFFESEHDLDEEQDNRPTAEVQLHAITGEAIQFQLNAQMRVANYVEWDVPATGERAVSIKLGNRSRTFTAPNPLNTLGESSANAHTVVAPMTGVIRLVHQAVGATITEGTPLVVLEAMKMETTLIAPRDGRIEAVFCKNGDSVSDGDVLIRLEEASDDNATT